jgi:hypothetical protein
VPSDVADAPFRQSRRDLSTRGRPVLVPGACIVGMSATSALPDADAEVFEAVVVTELSRSVESESLRRV